MSQAELIIIISGILGGLGLIVISLLGYYNKVLSQTLMEAIGPVLSLLKERGEEIIVETLDLSAVHAVLKAIEGQVQPDAALLKKLADALDIEPKDLSLIAQTVWKELEDWTDGELEPPVEAIPKGESK